MRMVVEFARDDAGFSIALEPGVEADAQPHWMELLANGLTFDLAGLAPGPAAAEPPEAHRIDLPERSDAGKLEAVTLQAGPHIAGGARMLPAVRSLALLSARLAALPGVRAVAWHPARCWNSPARFRETVLRWIDGGPFPAFSLAALASMPDGGMQSEGLALFAEQELRLEPELAADRRAAAETALHLMHRLLEQGPLKMPDRVPGPDGVHIRLEPSANGRFVRAWRG